VQGLGIRFSAGPYVFAFLVLDDLLARTLTSGRVVLYVLGMAVCYLLQGACNYWFNRLIWPTANNMVKRLRLMVGNICAICP
jgi:hypothetical protein